MEQADTGSSGSAAEAAPHAFLIADVRGYSTFTRERGDAAAAMLAKKFADLARDSVEARTGRVIELRGDEAFAVFDSASQAVRAAVELQATFAEESLSDPNFQLPVGIGIDAGEAVPVEDGYRGIAVNMAARLCSSAAAGQVLVTRAVTDLVGVTDDLVFADRGRATFKGFDEPVEVIEALALTRPSVNVAVPTTPQIERLVPPDGGLPPELDSMTPLVDRDREMRWLRGTWRQVQRGHGRVVFVSGPGQIGKTRLAAEFAAYLHAGGASVLYAGPGGAGPPSLRVHQRRDRGEGPYRTDPRRRGCRWTVSESSASSLVRRPRHLACVGSRGSPGSGSFPRARFADRAGRRTGRWSSDARVLRSRGCPGNSPPVRRRRRDRSAGRGDRQGLRRGSGPGA